MKKLGAISWILCIALLLQVLSVPVMADETQPQESLDATVSTESIDVTAPPTPEDLPDYYGQDASIAAGPNTIEAKSSLHGTAQVLQTAQAAMLFEINSQTMVYTYNPDMEIEPASLAKIMTALICVEEGNLDDIVTIHGSTLDSVGVNDMDIVWDLEDGEQMPLRDLLYCMLVVSSNNAAAIIAEHLYGSQEAFVDRMNQRAKELGCTHTHFTNPHGIHEEGMYTTCRDMVRIIMAAIEYEEFCEPFGDDYYYVEVTNLNDWRGLYSRNYMIGMLITDFYYDYRVTGGRTGVTSNGRSCFASTFETGDLSYISIVYGADPEDTNEWGEVYGTHHVFQETQQLIDIGCEGYSIKQVLRPGQITSYFAVNNGSNDIVAGPNSTVTTLLPNGIKLDDLTLRYEKTNGVLDAPVKAGDVIDTLLVWYGDVCVAQSGLVTMNSSQKVIATQTEEENGDKLGVGLTIFLAIVGVILGAAAVLYIIRFVNTGIAKSRRRRRRKSRRRNRG